MKWIYREILHNAEVDHGFFATLEDATRECERAIAENKVAIAIVAHKDILEGETVITPAGTVGWWARATVA